MTKEKLSIEQKAEIRQQKRDQRRAAKRALKDQARAELKESRQWDKFVARMKSLDAWIDE